MSTYHEKLLELIAIERKSDKYFLHIRLYFEQDIEIYWEIDEHAAEALNSVTEFGNKYRYRLSFHSSWDAIKKQHISLLTRTYLEQSERIYFTCSESFTKQLANIKDIQNINDIDTLTFISTNLQQETEQQVETRQEKQDEVREEKEEKPTQYRHNYKSILAFVAVMCVLSVILLGFSSMSIQEKPTLNDGVLAQSIEINNQNAIIQSIEIESDMSLPQDEKLHHISSRGYNRETGNIPSNKTTIPIIELEESIIYSVPEGSVALTFDDGPSIYSKNIVDILNEYEVGGTFFYIGLNIKKYPENVQYVHSNGYQIGSHSMNHVNVTNLSYEKQKDEFLQSCQLIKELTNEDVVLIRPPFGAKNKQTRALADENEYKMVLWNNDPKDWQTRNADKIFDDIKNSDVSGSIILLHESQFVLDALPRIIEYLQDQGLNIVGLQ